MLISFLRSLLPPIFQNALRRIIATVKGRPTYEPIVYSSADACPAVSDGVWSSVEWLTHVETDGRRELAYKGKDLNIHQLALVTAAVASLRNREGASISILDFGGGVGLYFNLVQTTLRTLGIQSRYAVVDTHSSCEVGRRVNRDELNLRFFDLYQSGLNQAHDFLGVVDVCNVSSTLHYCLNWRDTLEDIIKLFPKLICISRAPTPDKASQEGYVIQHITTKYGYCGAAKVVLIPADVLIETMEYMGYKLLFEQGLAGDARWYWEAGCSSVEYRQLTTRAFVFIRHPS
jgi:putative methyltransferase (TIGR04325 family)